MARLSEPVLDGSFLCTNYVEDLAKIQEQIRETSAGGADSSDLEALCLLYLCQAFVFEGLGESKLVRQSLESARQGAAHEQQKLVYDCWARFYAAAPAERKSGLPQRNSQSDVLQSESITFCSEHACEDSESHEPTARPKSAGSDRARCSCRSIFIGNPEVTIPDVDRRRVGEGLATRVHAAENVVLLTVQGQFVACSRSCLAELSAPFSAMLTGQYQESRKMAIPFDHNGLSPVGLQAVESFSRTGSLERGPGTTCERWLPNAGKSSHSLEKACLLHSSSSNTRNRSCSSPHHFSDELKLEFEDEEASTGPSSTRRLPTSSSDSSVETDLDDEVPRRTVLDYKAEARVSSTGIQKSSSKGVDHSQVGSSEGPGMTRMASSKALRSEFSGGFGKGMKIRVASNGELKALDAQAQECDCSCIEASQDQLSTDLIVEVLLFANRFCCEGLKAHCDERLAKTITTSEEAASTLPFALEESCSLLVGRCLKLLFEKLPRVLISDPGLAELLIGKEVRKQLKQCGFASFVFYFFLAHTLRDSILTPLSRNQPFRKSKAVDLAEACLRAALTFPSPPTLKAYAQYQLGCLALLVSNRVDAQEAFGAALTGGYEPARVGLARLLALQGDRFSARKEISKLLSDLHVAAGWIFQELAICSDGVCAQEDLDTANRLCPTLTYPYKYRAVQLLKEGKPEAALQELDLALQFMVTPDLLEFRAYCHMTLQDYARAARDLRVLLTLEPQYMLYEGRVSGAQFLKQLSKKTPKLTKGECWLRLYERWSAVDDIGSLAVVHKMLETEPGSAALLFRQSLLLHRVGCSDAAMRALRAARDSALSDPERLVYEGWILFDTGRRAEAHEKAQLSVSLAPSFEGYFLQAYALSDSSFNDHGPGVVIELLERALKCPSDGLRKGQALNNLGSVYVDCGRYREAAECFANALRIRHTRAHQGLARVHAMQGNRKLAYEEITKLINRSENNAAAYEKRSEYCTANQGLGDLDVVTRINPLRTYPYRYRAAVMMDTLREAGAIEELSRAIAFKVDVSLLHLRAEFLECQADLKAARRDARAALAIDPNHGATQKLWESKLEGPSS